jgi:hypothetical protein
VEDKHRFFAWLLLQCKILTADKLAALNWFYNPVCQLCDQHLESAEHLILRCVYAREVWSLVSAWAQGHIKQPRQEMGMEERWNSSLQGLPKKSKQSMATLLIYTAWNIWKERNWRVFDGKAALPPRILALIKEEVQLRSLACGDHEVLVVFGG